MPTRQRPTTDHMDFCPICHEPSMRRGPDVTLPEVERPAYGHAPKPPAIRCSTFVCQDCHHVVLFLVGRS